MKGSEAENVADLRLLRFSKMSLPSGLSVAKECPAKQAYFVVDVDYVVLSPVCASGSQEFS